MKEKEQNFEKDIVPVVLSADNNYAPYLGVCIQSIISNSSDKTHYCIYILDSNIDHSYKQIILKLQKKNITIDFIDINPFIKENTKLFSCSHAANDFYSPATYYRLFLPKIFNQYDKIIYLDCDMTILQDVSCLYNIDIGDNFVGVTHDVCVVFSTYLFDAWSIDFRSYAKNILNLDARNDYFQAGVMIWNLKKCREHNLTKIFLSKLEEIKNPRYVDQDIMNAVFCGKNIFWINQRWDVAWDILLWGRENASSPKDYIEQYKKNLDDPWIIHYTSSLKPWNTFNVKGSEYFWKYAKNSPFYEEILYKLSKNNIIMPVHYSNNTDEVSIIRDTINLFNIKLKYYKCKILQNITFGKRRTHYKNKRKMLKNKIKQVNQFLNQSQQHN